MLEWMLMPYRKLYRLIEGRSSRSEYWFFTLQVLLVYAAFFLLIFGMGGAGRLGNPQAMSTMMAAGGVAIFLLIIPLYIYALLTGVAGFAVTVRRLHDLGFSGWFLLLYYMGIFVVALIAGGIGTISPTLSVLLFVAYWGAGIVALAMPGTKGPNRFGEDPLRERTNSNVFD